MTSLKLHTVCVISMGTFCVVAMLRTAALASRPCVGRRSTSLAITRGSTSTSKRGLAAHASSHGDDHHHDAAHHHHPPPMPPFARLPVPTQKVRLGRYDFTRQTFLVWISKVVISHVVLLDLHYLTLLWLMTQHSFTNKMMLCSTMA
jgi:hypothetical protein